MNLRFVASAMFIMLLATACGGPSPKPTPTALPTAKPTLAVTPVSTFSGKKSRNFFDMDGNLLGSIEISLQDGIIQGMEITVNAQGWQLADGQSASIPRDPTVPDLRTGGAYFELVYKRNLYNVIAKYVPEALTVSTAFQCFVNGEDSCQESLIVTNHS